MSRNTRTFSDLDLNFIQHPVTKDISKKYDVQAIKTSIKNLLMTRHFERPFHSEIGSSIYSMLFDLSTPGLELNLRRVVIDLINNFEPRVRLTLVDINTQPDSNSVDISIHFTILNTSTPHILDVTLHRSR